MKLLGAIAMSAVLAAVITSVGLPIAWVGIWSVIVPLIFDGWTWQGYDALVRPLFFIGGFAGAVVGAITGMKGASRKRRR